MTRIEHLAWCKQRADEYLDSGDHSQAWMSMISDLGKHEETQGHVAIELGMMITLSGGMNNVPEVRAFIAGFN